MRKEKQLTSRGETEDVGNVIVNFNKKVVIYVPTWLKFSSLWDSTFSTTSILAGFFVRSRLNRV
jgi:hypothetical protein